MANFGLVSDTIVMYLFMLRLYYEPNSYRQRKMQGLLLMCKGVSKGSDKNK